MESPKTKTCSKCKEEKKLENFYAHETTHDRKQGSCKECQKKQNKEYRQIPEVKAKIKVRVKKRSQIPEVKARLKAWHKEHDQKPEIKTRRKKQQRTPEAKAKRNARYQIPEIRASRSERRREREKERYANDPLYRFTKNTRRRIALGLKGQSKSERTEWYLSCSFEEALGFLEKGFRPPMTRANMGEVWEVDHIRPVCSFDLSDPEQVKACFHYTNLQPLFIEEKRKKSGKYQGTIGPRKNDPLPTVLAQPVAFCGMMLAVALDENNQAVVRCFK